MVKIKRVYGPSSPADGRRILIDRLWPRGIKKKDAHIDEWLKDIAPSSELRKWFGHDPERWNEFKKRFFTELRDKKDLIDKLAGMARNGTITLLYGSKEERFNNAVALKEHIETRIKGTAGKKTA